MKYQEEVLKQFPNALVINEATHHKTSNSIYIDYGQKVSNKFELEDAAWRDFYEKYYIPKKYNMKLTRKDFEGLEVGTEITTLDNRVYKFNHIVNDLVFMINSDNKASIVPIDYMNQHYFTIQKTKQYYQGWEIGDYSGKNVWVKVSDISFEEANKKSSVHLLKSVFEDRFRIGECTNYQYAVQLTEVNTEKMKVK